VLRFTPPALLDNTEIEKFLGALSAALAAL
jgi:hypothetical protein